MVSIKQHGFFTHCIISVSPSLFSGDFSFFICGSHLFSRRIFRGSVFLCRIRLNRTGMFSHVYRFCLADGLCLADVLCLSDRVFRFYRFGHQGRRRVYRRRMRSRRDGNLQLIKLSGQRSECKQRCSACPVWQFYNAPYSRYDRYGSALVPGKLYSGTDR